ncbi:MAG: peptidylprolyl isomerase [Porticoccaceae bacterium]|nr:peptidylprolyl isomerase [Porticoccaceae bacterium]
MPLYRLTRHLLYQGLLCQRLLCKSLATCCLLIFCTGLWAETDPSAATTVPKPRIIITTTRGDIEVELTPEKAPLTVRNFLQYADRNYYDGAIFHRVIQGFMIQAGGFDRKLNAFEPGQPVINESVGGLPNIKGSIAMARGHDPDSARAEFFINLKHNRNFDAKYGNPGYTVFGQVVSGMAVVQSIATSEVEKYNHQFIHWPIEDIIITGIRRSPAQ